MLRSGASEAIGRFLPPSCEKPTASLPAQTVIQLPKTKHESRNVTRNRLSFGTSADRPLRKRIGIAVHPDVAQLFSRQPIAAGVVEQVKHLPHRRGKGED